MQHKILFRIQPYPLNTTYNILSYVSSCVSPQAQTTRSQVIPSESCLVLTDGNKFLELASPLELETGPRIADP